MTTTSTARGQYVKPDVGSEDNSWGTDLNTIFDDLDVALHDVVSISVAGSSDVTLTRAQALAPILILTGALTGDISLVVPNKELNFTIYNNSSGSHTVTVKPSGGSGVTITQGKWSRLYCDGAGAVALAFEILSATTFGKSLLAASSAGAALTTLGFSSFVSGLVDDADSATALTTLGAVGKTMVPIPAIAMTPATTNGPSSGSTEATTNKNMIVGLDFDASTQESAQFDVMMPDSWNEGTVTAVIRWMASSGTGNVVWGLQGVAYGDGDTLDAAFGTAQEVTDGVGTTGTERRTSETSAITIAGTPAAKDRVLFKIYRKAADAADTFSADARLLGVELFITINAGTDTA